MHYSPTACRCLNKSNPVDETAFAWGRNNPDCPTENVFCIYHKDFLSPSTVWNCFDWTGPAQLVDRWVVTNLMAFAKCVSQCLNIPAHIALSVVLNCPLYFSTFPTSCCMIGNVIYPLNDMLFDTDVYEIISEMSPIVWLNSFKVPHCHKTCFSRPRKVSQAVAQNMFLAI